MIFPLRDDVASHRTPFVTYLIIAANVLALLWLTTMPPAAQSDAVYEHGFIPLRIAQLNNPQPVLLQVPVPAARGFPPQIEQHLLEPAKSQIYLSLVTAMFLHGGWLHLIGNMWFLWVFGDNVESRLGHLGYAALYLVGGILASLCHWFMQPDSATPVIGASGAVAAVLGAYVVTWPFARIHSFVFLVVFFTVIELPALVVLGYWFLVQVVEARAVSHRMATEGVAWWAHVGGFLAGMILMQVLTWNAPEPTRPTHLHDALDENEGHVFSDD